MSFLAMDELDGDIVRLNNRGKVAERDIVQVRIHYYYFISTPFTSTTSKAALILNNVCVASFQFVPFREFEKHAEPVSRAHLAKAVLAEIPYQFLSYMKMRKIKPNTPKMVPALPPDPETL